MIFYRDINMNVHTDINTPIADASFSVAARLLVQKSCLMRRIAQIKSASNCVT